MRLKSQKKKGVSYSPTHTYTHAHTYTHLCLRNDCSAKYYAYTLVHKPVHTPSYTENLKKYPSLPASIDMPLICINMKCRLSTYW